MKWLNSILCIGISMLLLLQLTLANPHFSKRSSDRKLFRKPRELRNFGESFAENLLRRSMHKKQADFAKAQELLKDSDPFDLEDTNETDSKKTNPNDFKKANPSDNIKKANPSDIKKAHPTDIKKANPADIKKANPIGLKKTNPIDLKRANATDVKKANSTDLKRANSIDFKRGNLTDLKGTRPNDLKIQNKIDLKNTNSTNLIETRQIHLENTTVTPLKQTNLTDVKDKVNQTQLNRNDLKKTNTTASNHVVEQFDPFFILPLNLLQNKAKKDPIDVTKTDEPMLESWDSDLTHLKRINQTASIKTNQTTLNNAEEHSGPPIERTIRKPSPLLALQALELSKIPTITTNPSTATSSTKTPPPSTTAPSTPTSEVSNLGNPIRAAAARSFRKKMRQLKASAIKSPIEGKSSQEDAETDSLKTAFENPFKASTRELLKIVSKNPSNSKSVMTSGIPHFRNFKNDETMKLKSKTSTSNISNIIHPDVQRRTIQGSMTDEKRTNVKIPNHAENDSLKSALTNPFKASTRELLKIVSKNPSNSKSVMTSGIPHFRNFKNDETMKLKSKTSTSNISNINYPDDLQIHGSMVDQFDQNRTNVAIPKHNATRKTISSLDLNESRLTVIINARPGFVFTTEDSRNTNVTPSIPKKRWRKKYGNSDLNVYRLILYGTVLPLGLFFCMCGGFYLLCKLNEQPEGIYNRTIPPNQVGPMTMKETLIKSILDRNPEAEQTN